MNARKSLSLMIVALAAIPMFSSCDTTIDFWDQREVPINIPAGGPTSASNTQLVDLSQDSQVASQLKSIASVQVVEVWIQIPETLDGGASGVAEDNTAAFASGSLSIAPPPADGSGNCNESSISWTLVGDYTNLAIQGGTSLQIIPTTAQQAALTEIQTLAENAPNQFCIQYSGSFTGGSVDAGPSDGGPTGAVDFTVLSRIHLLVSVGGL